jgi:hypothetical protein
LLIDRAITKIVNLGSGTFDLFFAVMAKIDFVTEARRQLVDGDIFEFEQRKQSTKLRDRRTLGHLPRASTCFPLSAIGLAPQYRHEPDIQRPFGKVG